MDTTPPPRFLLLDIVRGGAVVLMVLYHFLFDLDYFTGSAFTSNLLIALIGKISLMTFLLLVGVSAVFRYRRFAEAGLPLARIWQRFGLRGAKIFGFGMVITVVSYLLDSSSYIRFGVLHLIGVSLFVLPMFVKSRTGAIVATLVSLTLGAIFSIYRVGDPYYVWLGLMPLEFVSLDYVPIFPYFGIVSLGVIIGSGIYIDYKKGAFHSSPKLACLAPIQWIGRHSLAIYLIHQPIIIASINAVLWFA